MFLYVFIFLYTRIYFNIYIYIYGTPHELPTLVLYGKYQIKPAFPAGPYSVSLKDYRNRTHISRERVCQLVQVLREVRDSASLKDYRNQTHISRERFSQLVQVRREHVINGHTVLFQSKSNVSNKNQKHLLRHYAAKLSKDGFFRFSQEKR